MQFGVSTHLFHGERLERQHFERIAAAGFDAVELFATRTHLDYHDDRSLAELQGWLADTGLQPWSMHAPITESFVDGVWGRALSNASADASVRDQAVEETRAAIRAAARLGCAHLVLHLGIPRGQPIPPNDNDPAGARRSLDRIAGACETAGMRLAVELIPNDLSTAEALVRWVESDNGFEIPGVCLDTGHAHLTGGVAEAIERLSGYITTTHVHDNRGKADEHLPPFEGTIDWVAAFMAFSKIGYSGPFIFELPAHDDAGRTLARAVKARRRIQEILDDLAAPFEFREE